MKKGVTLKKKLLATVSAGVLAATGVASALTSSVTAASTEDLGLDNYAKLLQ